MGVSEWNTLRWALYALAAGLAAGGMLMASALPEQGPVVGILAGAALIGALAASVMKRRKNPIDKDGTDAIVLEVLPPLAQELFAQFPDPLMLLDETGLVLFSNPAMDSVAGIDAKGKHISGVWRTPAVLEIVERAAASGEAGSLEFSLAVPVVRHFGAYAMRTVHAPHMTALLLHDMTALKQAERARADFIANASHELRTPLAAVSGFIDTLRGYAKDDEQAREKFLGIMSVEAERMRRLIEDLLSLTRIELNEHVQPTDEVDVARVVRDAAASLQDLARREQIAIEIANSEPLPPIAGDRDALMQLFQNLIHNAIKYGREGGRVRIDFAQSADAAGLSGRRPTLGQIAISIRDDGEGIPREAIPRLTERFYRVDVKRSRERGGTGLGLAIVKHIVNRHGGRLQIESQQGVGSTFTVVFPAAASA